MFLSKFKFNSMLILLTNLILTLLAISAFRSQAQEVVTVAKTYSPGYYGPIEVRYATEDDWKPLHAGVQLSGDDWIRMPPASLLRLIPLDSDSLPTFTGGQMRTVAQLLSLAKDATPPPLLSPAGKRVSVGAIPKASDISETRPTQQQFSQTLTEAQWQQLFTLVPEHDEKLEGYLEGMKAKAPYQKIPNLGKALWIFDQLRQLDIQEVKTPASTRTWQSPRQTLDTRRGHVIDYGLLYYTLLKLARIPVKAFPVPANIEMQKFGLYLQVNSSIPPAKRQKITINPWLVDGEDDVWIPLYISFSPINFTQAWYQGAIICRKMKAAKGSAP